MEIDKIVQKLKNGEIIIVPTDTVYGIIADVYNDKAVERVFKVKNRIHSKPFLILVSNMEMLKEVTKEIQNTELEIMNRFWPGPLTILLRKTHKISDLVTASSDYVAVRMPDNKLLVDIIEKLGRPVIAPSANISGSPSAHCIEQIGEKLKQDVDLIIDRGNLKSCESTIVKVENSKIKILREGMIKKEQLLSL